MSIHQRHYVHYLISGKIGYNPPSQRFLYNTPESSLCLDVALCPQPTEKGYLVVEFVKALYIFMHMSLFTETCTSWFPS